MSDIVGGFISTNEHEVMIRNSSPKILLKNNR